MINGDDIFPYSLLLFAIVCSLSAFWAAGLNKNNLPRWEKLSRNKTAGTILAVLGLLWSALHTKPLMSPSVHPFLIPAVFLCAWLSYLLLDYLFSRALGGMFILLAHYFLYESFALKSPFLSFFPLLFCLIGIAGIFLCGKPHLLRDLSRKVALEKYWKQATVFILCLYSIFTLILGVVHLTC